MHQFLVCSFMQITKKKCLEREVNFHMGWSCKHNANLYRIITFLITFVFPMKSRQEKKAAANNCVGYGL